MHKFKLVSVVLLAFLLPVLTRAQKNPKDPFQFPALHKIEMPRVQTVQMKNGMKLYLIEDPQYPTIDLRAMIRTGSIYDPADKVGLAAITGTTMRTGGTESRSGDELDQMLESLGASVETSIGLDAGYASVSVLKEDLDQGISVLADILMHPAFRQEKIDLAKIQMRSLISRRNDNVDQIADREYDNLIYGKDSPYSRYPEYATLDAVSRDDIVAFYKKYFHPNNILLAAWGDFKSADMQKKLEAAFARWPMQKTVYTAKPGVDYQYRQSVNFIPKNDVEQTRIQLGHIGGLVSDPDYPALIIMNQILSYDRMFKVLRSQEGLTYSPFGFYTANYDYPGVFICGTQTKSQSTIYATRLILKEVQRMTEEKVTEEELRRAKDQYLNSFVFNFDSKAKIVNRMSTYAYYGYPLDFIDKIKQGVERVTADDVLAVAKKKLHPQQLQILIVGKEADFDEPLSVLGPVQTIDITIPVVKTDDAPKASTETLEKGQAILQQVAVVLGGVENCARIENMSAKMDVLQTTPMGDMNLQIESLTVFPDRIYQSVTMPMGSMTMVVTSTDGWVKAPQGVMPLPEANRQPYLESIRRDPIYFLTNLDKAKVQYIGEKTFGEKPAIELLITFEDAGFHFFVDPATHIPLGASYQTIGREGPVTAEEHWSDYREVAGVKVPCGTVSMADGKQSAKITVKEIQANVTVDEKLFQK